MMARLGNWLSQDVTHALGWALIHSLWQCLGLAALAALAMAFSRRPSVRYLIATGSLVAMLAAPIATFLVLMKPAAPAQLPAPASAAPQFFTTAREPVGVTAPVTPVRHRAAMAEHVSRAGLPSANLLPANLLPWLVQAWLLGVALFSLRFAGGFMFLEYRRGKACRALSPRILALCRDVQQQLGIGRAIRYLECGWLQAPAVIGWLRPIVLLPLTALTGLSEMQLRAVIAHELAHIRRFDSFVNLLQILAETLLFHHPAIWWLNKRIRAERELCCDEIAIGLTGDRVEYARALTLLAQWEEAPRLAMAANRGPLSQRIFHILGRRRFGAGQRLLGLTVSLLFLVLAMGANTLLGAAHPGLRAKASLKALLPPSQSVARNATQVLQAGEAVASLGDGAAAPETSPYAKAAISHPAGKLLASRRAVKLTASVPDLSLLLPGEAPITPMQVAANDPPPAPTAPKAPVCALPTLADQIDLNTVPGSDLRTVPVAINGRPRQFLLDISTGPTEISQAAVADLGLPHIDRSLDTVHTDGYWAGDTAAFATAGYLQVALVDVKGSQGVQDYRQHVRTQSFTIGGATAHDLVFAVATDAEMGSPKAYDGLMTGDFFRQYDVELDFAQNKLNYLTPTGCTDPDQVAYWPHGAAAVIPMTDIGGKIQVKVSIQGQVVPAVIDTSSPHTVMRRDIAELVLGLKADTPDMMPDGDVHDGVGLQVYRHTFAQISFAGGVVALNVPALIQTN
ncbi:MAG TPA: M56 family metallopeptidase, partial [Rhizomicrobium sp.]|nr:M56 family metallopeptidase [Rhizomicrobium sp.]